MAKKEKRRSKFKGAVSRNAERQNRGAQYGYLKLPKGVQMFKEEPKSRIMLDIMPYEVTSERHPDRDDEYGIAVPGSLWYKRPYWLHRSVGSENRSVVCPTSIGQRCPICEYRKQLLKEGTKWDDESVRALKPSLRNLYVVIPRDSKNYESIPYIWDVSQFLFQDKLNEEIQENEEYETFPDLEEGYTLRIRFTEGTFGSNKFAEASRIDFIERKKSYDDSILEKIPHLDDLLDVPSYKQIEAMFFGNMDREDLEKDEEEDRYEEERDEEEEVESDSDSDSDDEDEEEEEEDEDEKEDDEDTDEEEEEEEEERSSNKPTRRSTPPSKPSKESKSKKGKCPHGHEFGKDCEEYADCEDCDSWDDCFDASPK